VEPGDQTEERRARDAALDNIGARRHSVAKMGDQGVNCRRVEPVLRHGRARIPDERIQSPGAGIEVVEQRSQTTIGGQSPPPLGFVWALFDTRRCAAHLFTS
jgi:hypothetical protein